MNETPSYLEDHSSQIPALQMLMKLGYTYLSPEEVERMRGGRTGTVLLEDILRRQIKAINAEKRISSTRSTYVSDANVENAIRALKELPLQEGYMVACQAAYQALTLGKTFDQLFDGELKSITVQYVDWQEPSNNVFHVVEEFSVLRSQGKEHYRPDIVLFVNGIPFGVIECKREGLKDGIKQAISQQLRNQQEDGIRPLFLTAQLLLCLASSEAAYGTSGTPEKFWAQWKEDHVDEAEVQAYQGRLQQLKNSKLPKEEADKLFSGRFRYVRSYFEALEAEEVIATEQDRYLVSLCRPERLLELTYGYVLFDGGVKKVARHQQFRAIRKAIKRIRSRNGPNRGGVIWHTQGSGKSLTMVMLAQAIAMDPAIRNPKIVLVTDRTDLDRQITETFAKCGMAVQNATTGRGLSDLLASPSDAVVTTLVNKFHSAIKVMQPVLAEEVFVLVDEGHRTQSGVFNSAMLRALPNACFIAMTGTPLFHKEKQTAKKFGGFIDTYKVDEAVAEGAVVPLLYEGRSAYQKVNEGAIDRYFELICATLTPSQKADLKRKFARADQLNGAEQRMWAIAWDISLHFRDNWQGRTPFKGQLVCDRKENALRYHEMLEEIGIVSSAVLISPMDEREGEDDAFEEASGREKRFWKRIKDQYGKFQEYEIQVINRYKKEATPEIIIVVDKLTTGFDEPRNSVLYLTRNLSGHRLLQTIARVNRVADDKEYGYVVDYYGVIENLGEALQVYSGTLKEFDEEDLKGTLTDIHQVISSLPQKHSEVWAMFRGVGNKRDHEAYAVKLVDADVRDSFYDRVKAFAKTLKVAYSSVEFYQRVDEATRKTYDEDLKFFLNLRSSVLQRYSDAIDYTKFEGQIQKLIDQHVGTDEVVPITGLVNIFDKVRFEEELEKTTGLAAKADTIASRTAKHISEKMDEDPVFYKRFSEMLQEVIADYRAKRMSERQYLERVRDLMEKTLDRRGDELPSILEGKEVAKAFYGLLSERLTGKNLNVDNQRQIAADSAIFVDELIRGVVLDNGKPVVDWQEKTNLSGKILIEIGDYLIDHVRDKYDVDLSFEEMDRIGEACIEVAKKRYR